VKRRKDTIWKLRYEQNANGMRMRERREDLCSSENRGLANLTQGLKIGLSETSALVSDRRHTRFYGTRTALALYDRGKSPLTIRKDTIFRERMI